jgi:hypothetical protein
MKRASLVLLLLSAAPLLGAEKWLDEYNRGVNAVRTNNFQAGAQALQHAVEEMPQENASQRVRDQIFTYVPHFWLGIARLNLADPDGALREWKLSEDQGAIQSTPYYAQLRDLIAKANSEKRRRSEVAATPAKQETSGAIGRALSAQMDAVSAGGNRSDAYHAAQGKLAEAKELSARAGVDVRAYKHAADVAEEARSLFASAADDAKKQRAARSAKPAPVPPRKPIGDVVSPFDDDRPQPKQSVPSSPQPQPQPPPPIAQTTPRTLPKTELKPSAEPQPEPESESLVAARIAVQQYRRRLLVLKMPAADAQRLEGQLTRQSDPKVIQRVVNEIAAKERDLDKKETAAAASKPVDASVAPDPVRARLETAYRAYAAGDFAASDRVLTELLSSKQSAEAFLLRGCSRYTQAMLSRNGATLLAGATSDIQSALRINRSLRLDRNAWSPKLVAFVEQVRAK